MTTSAELAASAAALPVLYPAAANEDFTAAQPSVSRGWDPFEVWRTRIKAMQEGLFVPAAR